MAYTMKLEGAEELSKLLTELGDKAPVVASMSLYEGAGKMADAVSAEARSIRTAKFKWAKPGTYRLPSPEEKQILMENGAMGIAEFDKNGSEINTAVGYTRSGYAAVDWNHMNSSARTNYKEVAFKGKSIAASSTLRFVRRSGQAEKYGYSSSIGHGAQNRKPVGVIANAINSGTSFMKKQPFFRKGMNKGKPKAEAAIIETAEKLFESIINRQNQDETGREIA